jgi:Chemotaxis protein histidine kinase and related kinases
MAFPKKARVINPPNVLKAKCGGGGYIDSDILARAEKAMETLKKDFDDWLADDIAVLTAAAKTYSISRDPATSGALFRAAHDLRGQATTYEFPLIARIAASLSKLIDGTDAVPMPLVAAHIDAIQVIHREKIKDSSNLMALTLVEELEGRVMRTLARA